MATKAKKVQDVSVQYTVPGDLIEARINLSISQLVHDAVEERVSASVADAVSDLVKEISHKRIAAAVDAALAEGWQKTDEYGSTTGVKRTLKERISDILNERDRYSNGRRWLDELVKTQVNEAISKNFKADIEAAREKFKSEVDATLTGVIKKAIAEHFGVKQ